MIEIHPDFFISEELDRFKDVFDSNCLQDVPNTNNVKACINRRFDYGKRIARFGRE
jgi:hypothetical protein